jgi:hypothetical protein
MWKSRGVTLEYFVLNSLPLILFLPGIFSLQVYLKSKNKTLPFFDLVLAGVVLWNFVFLVPSLLLSLFTPFIQGFFSIFMVFSLGMIILYLLYIGRDIVRGAVSVNQIFPKIDLFHGFNVFYLLLIWGFIFLLTMFTSIIQNVDAVIYYLPMAKAILQTGGLGYSPLYISEVAITYPPTLPLMYSFIMHATGDIYLRFIPVVYFLLTNVVIFQLSSRLSNRKVGFIAVVVYSSMLATQMLVVLEGLSFDLGYVFYTALAVYALLKGFDGTGLFWYLIAGISCGMAAVTKETGLLTLMLILSILLFHSKSKLRRGLFLVTSTLFFTSMLTIETFTSTSSLIPISTPYLHRLFLIAVSFTLFWYLSKSRSLDNSRTVKWSQIIPFLALAVFPCLFYLRNILSLGVLTPGFAPRLASAIAEAEVPSTWVIPQPPDLSSLLAVPFIFHIDWHLILLTSPVGLVFLIPSIGGLFFIARRFLRRGERDVQVLLMWFISLLVLWSYLSSLLSWPSYDFSFWPSFQYRRLYYFAPFLSIVIGYGFATLSKKINLGNHVLLQFVTYNTLVLAYIWFFRQSLKSFILRWIFEVTVTDVVLFSSLFVLVLFAPVALKKLKTSWKSDSSNQDLKKILPLLSVVVLLGNLLFPIYLVSVGTTWISRESWDPAFYNQLESSPPGLGREPWLEVIDFYRQNFQDDYVTLMFNSYVFAYFADRPVIDPYRSFSYEPLIPLLKIEDEEMLIQKLVEMRIRYFLLPKPTVPDVYSTFEAFANKYLLFRTVNQNPAFSEVKEFTFYKLYILN